MTIEQRLNSVSELKLYQLLTAWSFEGPMTPQMNLQNVQQPSQYSVAQGKKLRHSMYTYSKISKLGHPANCFGHCGTVGAWKERYVNADEIRLGFSISHKPRH